MKGAQLLKVFTGQPADDVAALTAEIDAENAKAAEACSRLEWLEREKRTADSFEAARGLDDQIAETRWIIGKAGERIPHLERQLQLARAERQAAALARHQAILRRRYPQFRAALQRAVAEQTAVIHERESAVRDLGEHVVQIHMPNLCYAGFLFEDLLSIWTGENDRIFSEQASKPAAVAPRPAPAPAPAAKARTMTATGEPLAMDHGFGWTRRRPGDEPVMAPEPPPRPKREPRRDTPPADGSQRQVHILRKGFELPDGSQSVIGDIVNLPAQHAEALVRNGAADFTTSVEKENDR